jgi:ribosome-associated translation inhibitor RaiA
MTHAVHEAIDDLGRQVKRHRDKRRDRRAAREAEPRAAASP